MKFVYVLTSCEKDLYYEQFLLSVFSLKFYNPDADIVVLYDNKTKKSLINKRTTYEKYISNSISISTPDYLNQKQASRWIKTSVNNYISDDFLYIDCDTIISDSLNYNFLKEISIAAVLDTHVSLDKHHLIKNFQNEDKNSGFSSSFNLNSRFNGGIIFCRDNSQGHNFYKKWHSLYIEGLKKKCSQDMPSLNQANYEMDNIIKELPGEWNCQISHNGLPYLSNAKIIHYYATSLLSSHPAFILASQTNLSIIKEKGEIPDEILKYIRNPKTAFDLESRIISGKEVLDVVNSNLFSKLLWIRKKLPNVFSFMNKLSLFIKNPTHN